MNTLYQNTKRASNSTLSIDKHWSIPKSSRSTPILKAKTPQTYSRIPNPINQLLPTNPPLPQILQPPKHTPQPPLPHPNRMPPHLSLLQQAFRNPHKHFREKLILLSRSNGRRNHTPLPWKTERFTERGVREYGFRNYVRTGKGGRGEEGDVTNFVIGR